MRSRRGKIAALGLGPRSHPDRFDPKSFLNATALMCAIALPLQVSPSSTPRKQSTPCAPAASATSTRCAAASPPSENTSPSLSPRPSATTHIPNHSPTPCSLSSTHMASDKRHLSEGVFRAKNAFYPAQMAFLNPKMPFDRCHLQSASYDSNHVRERLLQRPQPATPFVSSLP